MKKISYEIWALSLSLSLSLCVRVRACVCVGWGGGGPKTRWTGARKKKNKWGKETLILITQQVST